MSYFFYHHISQRTYKSTKTDDYTAIHLYIFTYIIYKKWISKESVDGRVPALNSIENTLILIFRIFTSSHKLREYAYTVYMLCVYVVVLIASRFLHAPKKKQCTFAAFSRVTYFWWCSCCVWEIITYIFFFYFAWRDHTWERRMNVASFSRLFQQSDAHRTS